MMMGEVLASKRLMMSMLERGEVWIWMLFDMVERFGAVSRWLGVKKIPVGGRVAKNLWVDNEESGV